jgi:hypothetical protein
MKKIPISNIPNNKRKSKPTNFYDNSPCLLPKQLGSNKTKKKYIYKRVNCKICFSQNHFTRHCIFQNTEEFACEVLLCLRKFRK